MDCFLSYLSRILERTVFWQPFPNTRWQRRRCGSWLLMSLMFCSTNSIQQVSRAKFQGNTDWLDKLPLLVVSVLSMPALAWVDRTGTTTRMSSKAAWFLVADWPGSCKSCRMRQLLLSRSILSGWIIFLATLLLSRGRCNHISCLYRPHENGLSLSALVPGICTHKYNSSCF